MKIQQKHSSKLLLISLVSYHVVPSTEKVLLSLSKSPSSPSAGKTVISFGAVLSDREVSGSPFSKNRIRFPRMWGQGSHISTQRSLYLLNR